MSEEFKAVETQEEFDNMVKDRIERAKNAVRSEFADYEELRKKAAGFDEKQAEFKKKTAEKDASIADLKKQLARYETDSAKRELAEKYKLPAGAAKFLTGDKKEDWEEAARELSQLARAGISSYPRKDTKEQVESAPPSMGARMAANLHRND